MTTSQTLSGITLDEAHNVVHHAEIQRERDRAINDLLADSQFVLTGYENDGPYNLNLIVRNGYFILDIKGKTGKHLEAIPLPLRGFKTLIKDYFLICESYYKAAHERHHSTLQPIDMARRGLHDDGAERLIKQLHNKIGLDKPTARRLFTLICVLQFRLRH